MVSITYIPFPGLVQRGVLAGLLILIKGHSLAFNLINHSIKVGMWAMKLLLNLYLARGSFVITLCAKFSY